MYCEHGKLHCPLCCPVCKPWLAEIHAASKAKHDSIDAKWIQLMNSVWNRVRGN